MPADAKDEFLIAIARANLLAPEQMTELSRWARTSAPDATSVAKELLRRGWLTQFQLKEVYKGRGADLTIGPYVLQELVGEGGMGRVFRARHTRLGRDVALKVIRKEKLANPQTVRRFQQEIQAVAQLSHPNVVLAFDADEIAGTNFLAMEFVDGIDLTKLVRERGPLPVAEACEYIRQGAIGLHHAFERGLVHRDVKPSNLLVAKSGQVKVLDLGLAMLNESVNDAEANRITQEGFLIGTPDFLAPEQARDPQGVDTRADIYGLGATLYYLLTGRVPYEGANATEKLLKHLSDPPPRLLSLRPDAPPQLDALIQWLMAKDPAHRPQTPLHAAYALQPFCPPSTGVYPTLPAPPSSVMMQPPGPPAVRGPLPIDPQGSSQLFRIPTSEAPAQIRERVQNLRRGGFAKWLVAIVLLVAVGVGGVVLFQFRQIPKPPPEPEFTNLLGMKMILLPAGQFQMGATDTDPPHGTEETPAHEVSLSAPFYMASCEVSNAQMIQLLGRTPSAFIKVRGSGELPAESVSWTDAQEFCKKLNERDSKKPLGWQYRLPTEAEWEYACRAGATTPFSFGEKLTPPRHAIFSPPVPDPLANSPEDEKEGETPSTRKTPGPIGKTEANAFGLYDLHGNVAEWCQDYYERGYPTGPLANPTGPKKGDIRAIRGGSFQDPATKCRASARRGLPADSQEPTIGFRVVLVPVG